MTAFRSLPVINWLSTAPRGSHVYGQWDQPTRNGNRGRYPERRRKAPPDLLYAQVVKQRERGSVVAVTRHRWCLGMLRRLLHDCIPSLRAPRSTLALSNGKTSRCASATGV